MTRICAPIALFVFNRKDHTERTVSALKRNLLAQDSDLFIFSDAANSPETARSVAAVREYVRTIDGFKSVKIAEQKENRGLAASIISGVTSICSERGRVIVMEDDLVTSPFFLQYMNYALDCYAEETRVAAISGFHPPFNIPLPETFFLQDAECWGWATWQRAWTMFNPDGRQLLSELTRKRLLRTFDQDGTYPYVRMLEDQIAGRVSSWAIRWRASVILGEKLSLYPRHSMVRNIGFDGSGVHSEVSDVWEADMDESAIRVERVALRPSVEAYKAFVRFNRRFFWKARLNKIVRKLSALARLDPK
jgi:hypothetical protein